MQKNTSNKKQLLFEAAKSNMYTSIGLAIYDYPVLIITKKHHILKPSLHSISNSIGQAFSKRKAIKDNQIEPIVNILTMKNQINLHYGRISLDRKTRIIYSIHFFEFLVL